MAIFTASQTQDAVLPSPAAVLQQPDEFPPYRALGSAIVTFSGNGSTSFGVRTIATATAGFNGSGVVVGAHFDIDTTAALFTGAGVGSAAVTTFNYENFGDSSSSGTFTVVAINGANFQTVTQGSGTLSVVAHT